MNKFLLRFLTNLVVSRVTIRLESLKIDFNNIFNQSQRATWQSRRLFDLEEGENEVFEMEEEEDEERRSKRASYSHRVMQVVGEIPRPRRSANLNKKREHRGKDLLDDYFVPNNAYPNAHFRRHIRMRQSLLTKS